MASTVEICNKALRKLGEGTRIASVTEGTAAAILCNDAFPSARDGLLRRRAWNFATQRTQLARLSIAPAFGYAHAYQLPSDWIATLGAWDDDLMSGQLDYRIEGGLLLTDAEEVYLLYTARVTDTSQFDTLFVEALALTLALEISDPLAASQTRVQRVGRELDIMLSEAASANAMDQGTAPMPTGSWLAARG